ncbi:MAG: thioether cross-link-forming SCIFF peptide maturase [Clostridia bacterium]|nr:thioether cross-link-forming SCIFF peptide maturase [Clostridia bacterium]
MVHCFTFEDLYLLYDVASGSLHACERPAYELCRKWAGEEYSFEGITEAELMQAEEELNALKAEGTLFAEMPEITLDTAPGEVKALCLHISHMCNFACTYCFAGGGSYNGEMGHMPFEVAKNAIDFLIERSGKRRNLEVDFFGGEPLMNFEVVKQTVAYAKERAAECGKVFKFTLTTNGLLLNDEITAYLNEEMENVVLSIDGRREVHDRVRKTVGGKDTYEIVKDKFIAFRKTRGDKSYYVRGTFTALNTDFAADILHMNDLGFDQISIEPVVLDKGDPLAITEEHLPRILEQYEILAHEYIKRRKTEKWFNFFHFMVDMRGGPCLKKRLTGCGAGTEYLAVTPSGKIYPCHRFAENEEYVLGDVFERKLNEPLREMFGEANLLTKPKCKNCFARNHCSGGCSANSIYLEGDIHEPYQLSCEMMRKRTELSFGIYAKELLSEEE